MTYEEALLRRVDRAIRKALARDARRSPERVNSDAAAATLAAHKVYSVELNLLRRSFLRLYHHVRELESDGVRVDPQLLAILRSASDGAILPSTRGRAGF